MSSPSGHESDDADDAEVVRRSPDADTGDNAEVEPGSAEEVERSRRVAEEVVERHDDADLPPGAPPMDPATTTTPSDPPHRAPPPRRDRE